MGGEKTLPRAIIGVWNKKNRCGIKRLPSEEIQFITCCWSVLACPLCCSRIINWRGGEAPRGAPQYLPHVIHFVWALKRALHDREGGQWSSSLIHCYLISWFLNHSIRANQYIFVSLAKCHHKWCLNSMLVTQHMLLVPSSSSGFVFCVKAQQPLSNSGSNVRSTSHIMSTFVVVTISEEAAVERKPIAFPFYPNRATVRQSCAD